MDVLKSRLGQQNNLLAREIQSILRDAEWIGAPVGVQRIEFICDQYDKISPDVAYQWMDLDSFQREIEDAQIRNRHVEAATIVRNILSLGPLIATWAALYLSVNGYQHDLMQYPGDTTTSFLQLWQTGFHGTTWFTFTVAAGTDVVLLSLYLFFILLSRELERRAEHDAVQFIQRLRATTEKLMLVVANANITPIRAPSDIDKVTVAIKQVVDAATRAVQQLVQGVQTSIDASNKRTEDLFQKAILPTMSKLDNNIMAFQGSLVTFQTQIGDLTKQTQQLAGDSAALAQSTKSYVSVGAELRNHVNDLNKSEQAVIAQLGNLTGGITSAISGITTASTNIVTATNSVTAVAKQLDDGLRMTTTQMANSVKQATAFQSELANFQTSLTGLNRLVQDLATTSTTLATGVQNYAPLANALNGHIATLNKTEHDLVTQLTGVTSNTTAAAGNMAKAANSVTSVAQGLNSNTQNATNYMTRATASLSQVENQLAVTTARLDQVAQELANLDLGNTSGGGGGGLLGGLFRRGTHRAKKGRARP